MNQKPNSTTKLTIYVEQFNDFWSVTPIQFTQMCEQAIKDGGGHDLTPYKYLKNRPKSIGVYRRDHRAHYYSKRKDVLLFRPLDWELWAYKDALEQLRAYQDELQHRGRAEF